jgi:hypothetical protein
VIARELGQAGQQRRADATAARVGVDVEIVEPQAGCPLNDESRK